MKALIRAPFDPSVLERLRASLEVIYDSWMDTRTLLSADDFVERINGQDIPIVVVEADFLMRDVFEHAGKLGFLGVCRADLNLVDVKAATEAGVLVVNTPARNDIAVAELAIGLMLALTRNIPAAHTMVSSGRWIDPTDAYFSMRGTELTGKTVGIVGLGAVGRQVAKRAAAFDTILLAYDPYMDSEKARSMGVKLTGLDELMALSDFVTLHCPAAPDTMGLIDSRRIALMKPASYLVNTASTFVLDGDAVVVALREKRIAGAAFDVYDTWPVRADSPLLGLDNVILTPHIGGATCETVARHSNMIADDIDRFLSGERPRNLVNPEVWGGVGQ